MRTLILICLAALTAACNLLFGPSVTSKDRAFQSRFVELVEGRSHSPLPASEGRALVDALFDDHVVQICFVGGGDWSPGVEYHWSNAEHPPPIPVDQLRDLGSDDLSVDGMVAFVGVRGDGVGLVRRGAFGDANCSDHSGGPICWPMESVQVEILPGRTYDAGPRAGETGTALLFANLDTGERSCRFEALRRR